MAEHRPLRLLVVEDEGMLVLMLVDMLEEIGYVVDHVASNIAAAIGIVERHGAALDGCVLDANLGGEFATPIARALEEAGVPFVIVSGYDSRELLHLGLVGPTVSKPYSRADLESALSRPVAPKAPA